MNQLDENRAAKMLISKHGQDAKTLVMRQVVIMRAAGNFIGEWAWMCVFDAVVDLETKAPESDQTTR